MFENEEEITNDQEEVVENIHEEQISDVDDIQDEIEVASESDAVEPLEAEDDLNINEAVEEDHGFLSEDDMSSFEEEEELLVSDAASEDLDLSSEEEVDEDDINELMPENDLSEDEKEQSDQVVFPLEEALSLKGQIEAAIFASPKPLKVSDLVEILSLEEDQPTSEIEAILDELETEYRDRVGGFRLEYIKRQGYQFRTVQAAAPLMEKIFSHRPRPLSKAALETLAIIAYRQPVTRADIEFVRGVDAGSIVKNLIDRELISCTGRKEVAGRPMLFGTTDEFLRVFGVGSIKELPPLSAFQPSPEMVNNALSAMDEDEVNAIDVEKLIGDGRAEPGISDGLIDEDEQADLSVDEPVSELFDEAGDLSDSLEFNASLEVDEPSTENNSDAETISENDELATHELSLGEVEEAEDAPHEPEQDLENVNELIIGATADGDAEEGEALDESSLLEQPDATVIEGAVLADMEGFSNDHRENQDSEMDVPVGDSIEAGSGEVDL